MDGRLCFRPYRLSALDHTIMRLPMSWFLSFILDEPTEGVQVLETGIRRLVSRLPFLTGDLAPCDCETDRINAFQVQPPFVSSFDALPLLQVRYHPGLYLSVVDYDKVYNADFIPHPFQASSARPHPILRFQANVTEDGILLCASFHHMAIDGAGMTIILNYLAKCCRASPDKAETIQLSTNFSKEASQRQTLDQVQTTAAESDINERHIPLENGYSKEGEVSGKYISRHFILSPEKVKSLRTACISLLRESDPGGSNDTKLSRSISHQDIVSAIIWKCMTGAVRDPSQRSSEPTPSDLMFTVDVRGTTQPPLGNVYLGNALVGTKATHPIALKSQPTDKDDIETLLALSLEIRRSITSVDARYASRLLSIVQNAKDWGSIQPSKADVYVSGMRNIPVYRLDFGVILGRTVHFDLPDARLHGSAFIMPAPYRTPGPSGAMADSREQPWGLRICLTPEEMERFRDQKLMRWVSAEVVGDMARL